MVSVEKQYTFLDYVRGGYEISLVTAVDFTASNGDPSQPSSLHYRNPSTLNDYQKAIISVGDILNYYDSDKKYPVFGFGARLPPRYDVANHCFPANLNWENPEVNGVEGILNAYNFAMSKVQLYGPTNFAQIINTAAGFAKRDAETNYYILLILTDGEITDMAATTDAIVQASTLPLSIIIVGIGNADFTKMDVLDADDNPLVSSNGIRMANDIVQFVPFNKFKNCHPSLLASEVLSEVPTQFLNYMKQKRILPRKPIEAESFYGSMSMASMTAPTTEYQPNTQPNVQVNLPQPIPSQPILSNQSSTQYHQPPPVYYNQQPPQQQQDPQLQRQPSSTQPNYVEGFPQYRI